MVLSPLRYRGCETEQKRRDPKKWDGMVESVERYLEAWAALDRDGVASELGQGAESGDGRIRGVRRNDCVAAAAVGAAGARWSLLTS